MKKYLIELYVKGSHRIFVKSEKELYSSLNWKDGYLRWGNTLNIDDVMISADIFKRNIDNLEALLKEFKEVRNVSLI